MARIVSIGAGLQDIYLMDRDDFAATRLGENELLGRMVVGSKVDIDKVHFAGGELGDYFCATGARGGADWKFGTRSSGGDGGKDAQPRGSGYELCEVFGTQEYGDVGDIAGPEEWGKDDLDLPGSVGGVREF